MFVNILGKYIFHFILRYDTLKKKLRIKVIFVDKIIFTVRIKLCRKSSEKYILIKKIKIKWFFILY